MKILSATTIGALVLSISTRAVAQIEGTPPPPRPWKLQTDIGLVNTAGNTSNTTLNVGEAASYTAGRVTLAQSFSMVYGRTEGKRSAENYNAGVRGDYAVSPAMGVYLQGKYNRDRFAGISRRFEEGAGLTLTAATTERAILVFEAGATVNQQWSIDGGKDDYAAGRGAIRFKRMLNKAAFFEQLAEVLPNFSTSEDVRVNTETALVAPVSAHIALKISYVIKFDNLPEPGFEKTDRLLTSGLQMVF